MISAAPHGLLIKTGIQEYRPKNGAKAIYKPNSVNVWDATEWTITENGTVTTFAQVETASVSTTIQINANVRWWPTKVVNHTNNAISISYKTSGNYVLPNVVKYNNVEVGGEGVVSVTYQYEEYGRADKPQKVDLNILKTLNSRLTGVNIHINNVAYRSYKFDYLKRFVYSRLQKVDAVDYLGEKSLTRTLKMFDWERGLPTIAEAKDKGIIVTKPCTGDCKDPEPEPDPDSTVRHEWVCEGSGRHKECYLQTIRVTTEPKFTQRQRSSVSQIRYGDFNGDGISDIYKIQNGHDKVFLMGASPNDPAKVTPLGEWNGGHNTPAGSLNPLETFETLSTDTYDQTKAKWNAYNNRMAARAQQLGNLFIGDFNGDGFDDIYEVQTLTNDGSNKDHVYLSDGTKFRKLQVNDGISDLFKASYYSYSNYKAFLIDKSFALSMVRQGDFDGDQRQDLALFRTNSDESPASLRNRVSLLSQGVESNGKFYFTIKTESVIGDFGNGNIEDENAITLFVSSLRQGDFNGDGKTDFYLAYPEKRHEVHISNGNGTFRKTSGIQPSSYEQYYEAQESLERRTGRYLTGDFNGDNITDLMVLGFNSNNTIVCPVLFDHMGFAPGQHRPRQVLRQSRQYPAAVRPRFVALQSLGLQRRWFRRPLLHPK